MSADLKLKEASWKLSEKLQITFNAAYQRTLRIWKKGRVRGIRIGRTVLLDREQFEKILIQGE